MTASPRARRIVSRLSLAVLIVIVALFVVQAATGNDQQQCPTTQGG